MVCTQFNKNFELINTLSRCLSRLLFFNIMLQRAYRCILSFVGVYMKENYFNRYVSAIRHISGLYSLSDFHLKVTL